MGQPGTTWEAHYLGLVNAANSLAGDGNIHSWVDFCVWFLSNTRNILRQALENDKCNHLDKIAEDITTRIDSNDPSRNGDWHVSGKNLVEGNINWVLPTYPDDYGRTGHLLLRGKK